MDSINVRCTPCLPSLYWIIQRGVFSSGPMSGSSVPQDQWPSVRQLRSALSLRALWSVLWIEPQGRAGSHVGTVIDLFLPELLDTKLQMLHCSVHQGRTRTVVVNKFSPLLKTHWNLHGNNIILWWCSFGLNVRWSFIARRPVSRIIRGACNLRDYCYIFT